MPAPFRLVPLNRLGFAAWAWATLLVILVSAAPDGGAPGSRAIGSAFDPATVSVTVRAQPPRTAVAVKSDAYAPPAMPASGTGEVAAAPLELASVGIVADGSIPAQRPNGPGDPRSLTRAHGARAPPII